MISGNEGSLTLTVGMRVSPEPEVIDLLERYRDALNYSIRKIIGHKATSLSKVHELLYNDLRNAFSDLFIDINGVTRFLVGNHPWVCVMCRKGKV
jgi:predicted transposase